jgi:type IV secretory pathway VirJ component
MTRLDYGDGQNETDALCPEFDPQKFALVKVTGDHHIDGDYPGLPRAILGAAKP